MIQMISWPKMVSDEKLFCETSLSDEQKQKNIHSPNKAGERNPYSKLEPAATLVMGCLAGN